MKAVLAPLLLLLAGCGQVLFESPPGDRVVDCDPDFVGSWRLSSPEDDDGDDDPLYVIVEPGCGALQFIGERGQEPSRTGFQIAFATVGATPILTVESVPDAVDGDEDALRWRRGYVLFRRAEHGGEIRLYPVDMERIAHAIVDGKLPGRVEKIAARPEDGMLFEVFVSGSRAEIAELVATGDIFSDRFRYVLTPVSREEALKAAGTP